MAYLNRHPYRRVQNVMSDLLNDTDDPRASDILRTVNKATGPASDVASHELISPDMGPEGEDPDDDAIIHIHDEGLVWDGQGWVFTEDA